MLPPLCRPPPVLLINPTCDLSPHYLFPTGRPWGTSHLYNLAGLFPSILPPCWPNTSCRHSLGTSHLYNLADLIIVARGKHRSMEGMEAVQQGER